MKNDGWEVFRPGYYIVFCLFFLKNVYIYYQQIGLATTASDIYNDNELRFVGW